MVKSSGLSRRASRANLTGDGVGEGGADNGVGGAKNIDLVGGVALLINNITGSAMVLFPALYQSAGWVVVSLVLFGIALLSYLCSIMIIEAMAAMPANHNFEKRVEYTSLSYFYLGKRGYQLTQFFFQFSLAFNNLSSIIQSVQVMDFAIVAIAGRDCAIPEFYPNFSFHCPSPVEHDITPFGPIYLLSIGFLVTALVVAPLGLWNLDDSIIIQKVSCTVVVSLVLTWAGLFIGHWGLDASRVAAMGTQFTNVLGICVFNFAVITSIPSWVNEKKDDVSILKTMFYSIGMALGLFSILGIMGGMAFQPDDSDETLLNKLQNSSSILAKVTFYIFPCVVSMTSIPVFAIMQRYNLLEAKVCSKNWANFFGVILPWLICIPFYTGTGFSIIVNWGGIIFNSVINFIIPPMIYIAMVRKQNARIELATNRLLLDEDDGHSGYVPPGVVHSVKHTTVVIAKHSAKEVAVLHLPVNQLGPHSRAAVAAAAALEDTVVGDSLVSHHGAHGLYHPSDVDVRTAEEEERDEELLHYDPYDAERLEAEVLEAALERKRTVSITHPHHLPPSASNLQHLLLDGEDASITIQPSHLTEVFVPGWTAMPKWIVPYRLHMAGVVAILLAACALIVVALNIHQCVTSGCN